jgi:hypothetical protein
MRIAASESATVEMSFGGTKPLAMAHFKNRKSTIISHQSSPLPCLPILCAILTTIVSATPLALAPFNGPTPSFREPVPGTYEITGPMSVRATPAEAIPPGPLVLEFEYFCVGGVPAFAVLPGPPYEARTHRRLPAIGHSEAWSPYAAPLDPPDKPLPNGWKSLRLDLPVPASVVLQLRNIRLRGAKPGEFAAKTGAPAASEAAILAYLEGNPRSFIDDVRVTTAEVIVSGRAETGREILLAEIPIERLMDDPKRGETTHPIERGEDGRFSISLPRIRDRGGRSHDRLLSRWQLVTRAGDGIAMVSHARYADHVATRQPHPPAMRISNKKGLGGWNEGRMPGGAEELDELGIAAVTVNIVIHSLVSLAPGPNTTPITWQGRTYHARENVLARYDRTFLEAARRGIVVSAILLVANPARVNDPVVAKIGHPDAVREGTYAMPNVTDPEGIALYGAILNLMAERWSRADGKYGRVHHWIMHNEVDAGWVWTNAGDKTAPVYMDLLHRSLRLMDLIARQYDPNARPFLSLTHHWAEAGPKNWYGSKTMIDLLARFSHAEGDFAWAVAYHPYPQDLRNPRTWEDHQATGDFNTKKITPHNIGVLDAYMRQPRLLHRGAVRPIHLSENGFNSRDYSEKELADQAAGMAYVWDKIRHLDSIEVWHYHNWIDNRHEGGLRLGLRKFPDEPGDPFGKKPIWHVYQALGTPREEVVTAPYLEAIRKP